LPDILAAFLTAAPLLAEQTRQREEENRQYQLAEQRRYEEEQRRKRDNNRWKQFLGFAREWCDVDLARGFLAALKGTGVSLDHDVKGQSLADWIAWVERRIESGDPLKHGAEAIFETVAAVNEFTQWRE
jgi:hypothetical protein